jgi:hypothetical protein
MQTLTQGELIDEAAENAGLDPSALTARHLASMTRSLFLVFTAIENEGAKPEYRVDTTTFTLQAGQGAIILPEDTVDVTEVAFDDAASGVLQNMPLSRTNRSTWLMMPDTQMASRPTAYFVSKSLPAEMSLYGLPDPGGVADRRLLVLYPRNARAGARVTVNRLRYIGMPSNLASDIDARRNWIDTIQFGLAARTALKFNEEKYDKLEGIFQSMLAKRMQSEDRSPTFVGFRGHGWSRRRRH